MKRNKISVRTATLLLLITCCAVLSSSCKPYKVYAERGDHFAQTFWLYKNGTYVFKMSACVIQDSVSGTWIKNKDTFLLTSYCQPIDSIYTTFDSTRTNKIILFNGQVKTITINNEPQVYSLKGYIDDNLMFDGQSFSDQYALILPTLPIHNVRIDSYWKGSEQEIKGTFVIKNPNDNFIEIFFGFKQSGCSIIMLNEKWLCKRGKLHYRSANTGEFNYEDPLPRIRFLYVKGLVWKARRAVWKMTHKR